MNGSSASNETSSKLGSLVRLRVLNPSSLPSHPVLSPQQGQSSSPNGTPPLQPFITQVLTEGAHFIDKTVPGTFTSTNTKVSPPSEARVDSSKGKISKAELLKSVEGGKSAEQEWRDEFWFARRSVHVQGPEVGRAPWSEFVDGLLRAHSVNEADYTPNVFDAREICNWEEQLNGLAWEGYEEVRMCSKCSSTINGEIDG